MNILSLDAVSISVEFCIRCQDAGHDVRLWLPKEKTGDSNIVGDGLVDKVDDWRKWMDWADLIVLTFNAAYRDDLEPYFKKGYPIFGCNRSAGELELDRGKGQEVMNSCGLEVPEFEVFNNYDKAIAYVKETNKALVSKPWGGSLDKALSYVSKSPADLVFKLQKWKREGIKANFILQEKVDGTELAVGGWFGPRGWSRNICENFEEKSFMNEGLGGNTGEQGTVLRYVKKSKLFDELLEPITDCLHELNYVGYCDINAMITEEGKPKPLEFTMRPGEPTLKIQQALHLGDPAQWMLDLLQGKDTLKTSLDIAVGVALTHGDYPHNQLAAKACEEFPLYGVTSTNRSQIYYGDMMRGVGPMDGPNGPQDTSMDVTAGNEVAVVVGTGATVREAQRRAYKVAWSLSWPSNVMFRTDIGDRLAKAIPKLQSFGYVKGMEF